MAVSQRHVFTQRTEKNFFFFLANKVWAAGWNVVHHHTLPDWLKDNDFLLRGHRTPTNSFVACFKSIFRIHTETGNIWTHLLGM